MTTTPKLSRMTARTVCVPHAEPHRTASGVITESPLVLTDLELDSGETGRSMVFTYTRAALKPVAEFMRNLWPMIEGDALAPVEIEQKLNARFRLLGTQGLVGMALAGLDMALWDAMARAQGLSLARLLGGAPKPLRTYGAIGYDGPAGSARAAEAWAKAGFPGAKAKVGYPSVAEDLAAMKRELTAGMRAGAIGFSTSRSGAHRTPSGKPVASRVASWDEFSQLVGVLKDLGHGIVEIARQNIIPDPVERREDLLAHLDQRDLEPAMHEVLGRLESDEPAPDDDCAGLRSHRLEARVAMHPGEEQRPLFDPLADRPRVGHGPNLEDPRQVDAG